MSYFVPHKKSYFAFDYTDYIRSPEKYYYPEGLFKRINSLDDERKSLLGDQAYDNLSDTQKIAYDKINKKINREYYEVLACALSQYDIYIAITVLSRLFSQGDELIISLLKDRINEIAKNQKRKKIYEEDDHRYEPCETTEENLWYAYIHTVGYHEDIDIDLDMAKYYYKLVASDGWVGAKEILRDFPEQQTEATAYVRHSFDWMQRRIESVETPNLSEEINKCTIL